MDEILHILPTSLHDTIQIDDTLEEIRIRLQRLIEVIHRNGSSILPHYCTTADFSYMMSKLSQFSIYMLEEELKRGYITTTGGHRVGLAGKVITEQGKVKMIRDVSSLNIRIARERIGCADRLGSHLYTDSWKNTLLIGPPKVGKTTILRDIARIISTGFCKVGIVDERSEIAGCVDGIPSLTFGTRVDVLDACPKADGMMMLIRSMSPDVLIVDEIGRREDSLAVLEAMYSGVKVMATAHGNGLEDIQSRPSMELLFTNKVFERFVLISRKQINICDQEGEVLQCLSNS